MTRKLSVVTDGTAPHRPANIKDAVEMTERDLLSAMRHKVAAEIDSGVPAHALAPLMRQLRELDKDLRALKMREHQEAQSDDEVTDEAFDSSAV